MCRFCSFAEVAFGGERWVCEEFGGFDIESVRDLLDVLECDVALDDDVKVLLRDAQLGRECGLCDVLLLEDVIQVVGYCHCLLCFCLAKDRV